MLGRSDARAFEDCLAAGGVALFPADTVYGLACDPDREAAVARLYELKQRPAGRPAAIMFFSLATALAALHELDPAELQALHALVPGPVTLLLPNRARRFALACGPDPDTLGVRVPRLSAELGALGGVRGPVLQSSANLSGEPEARRLVDVSDSLRLGADLVLDGGELPGVASTVVDLRAWASNRSWSIVRGGAVPEDLVNRSLAGIR